MGQQYRWSEIREEWAAKWSRYPDAAQEAKILEAFQERPAFVVGAIADVGRGYESGRVHSPWQLLCRNLERSPVELVVDDETERNLSVKHAVQWIRVAGLHYDRESELEDDLFGDTGRLRAWRSDEALRARLLDVWRQVRPQGEQLEREDLERAQERIATRARVVEAVKQKLRQPGFEKPDKVPF